MKIKEPLPLSLARRPDPFGTLKAQAAAVGLSWPKVKARLPDWAEEALEHEAGRVELEGYIARHFGFRVRPDGGLEPAPLPQALFKVRRDTQPSEVVAARGYATAVARAVALGMAEPWTPLPPEPSELRAVALALSQGRGWVDFEALVAASWRFGIPVLHLPELPVGGKKPDGMVTFVAGRPVVVLLKGQALAEWMVFILAHELGHIAMGHLGTVEGSAVVDEKVSLSDETPAQLDPAGGDGQENQANSYASGVLVAGGSVLSLGSPPWPVAERLAERALAFGRLHQVSPGHAVLNAARHSIRGGRSPFALGMAAAKALQVRLGTPTAAEACRAAAREHLDLDLLRLDTLEFLEKLEVI